jgi:nucleotide-binding universal stress UspA family protein
VLDAEVQRVQSAGGTIAHSHLVMGEVAWEIVHLAEDLGVGLIVMGSRGRGGIRRAFIGSISASVVRYSHCPVLVVRGESVILPTKILLVTDGSEDANLASSTAADLSMSTGSELHVVRVGHMPSAYYESPGAMLLDPDLQSRMEKDAEEATKTRLGEQVQMIRETGSEVTEAHARIGRPDAEIVGLAGRLGAGLIVVGSRGLGPLRRTLIGSISDSVVRHAHCPVMVVRHVEERAT